MSNGLSGRKERKKEKGNWRGSVFQWGNWHQNSSTSHLYVPDLASIIQGVHTYKKKSSSYYKYIQIGQSSSKDHQLSRFSWIMLTQIRKVKNAKMIKEDLYNIFKDSKEIFRVWAYQHCKKISEKKRNRYCNLTDAKRAKEILLPVDIILYSFFFQVFHHPEKGVSYLSFLSRF